MHGSKKGTCVYVLCLYHYWKNRFLKPQDLSVRKSIEINSFRLPWKLIAAVCDCRTFMNDDDFSLRSDLEDEISDHNRNIVIISITNFGIEIIGGIQYLAT